ncbi:MAG: hypothetical protein M3N13_07420 [Candidatus Eremiobacteraeota bacterium]|nr:hypothetical protein [Candidatus Eremiobacteraeota bacterium]
MRTACILLSAVLVVAASLAPASAAGIPNNAPPPQPLTFSDGAVATPTDHCGDADLCATIVYPNGDNLFIYSEGAAYCQPYMLHFVRVRGAATLFEYSRTINHDPPKAGAFGGTTCGNSQATQMTFDRGLVHLTVDEYRDGSLRFVFTKTGP